MFTQHLIKNCLWLLAAVQCFSPPHLSRFLVVVMTTFMLQIGFVNGVFAEDVTTTDAITTVTDPITDTTTTDVAQNTLPTGIPSIFMGNTSDGLLIEVKGVPSGLIEKLSFDGADVTDMVSNFVNQGVAKITETENSFSLLVNLSQPILGNHTLGFTSPDGVLFSKSFNLEVPNSDKLNDLRALEGYASYKVGWGIWNNKTIRSQKIRVVYRGTFRGKDTTGKYVVGSIFYPVEVKTEADGKYKVSCELASPVGEVSVSPKEWCYKADTAYFFYSYYSLGPINLYASSIALARDNYNAVLLDRRY